MASGEQELEIKLWVRDLEAVRARAASQSTLVQPRTYEINLRFDLPDLSLSRTKQVLRLRQDQKVTLTYKGPGSTAGGVQARREIELTVDHFETARHFLEALGYQVQLIYEKYRTTYQYHQVIVTMDEMPYGGFVELEGPDGGSIREACDWLGLDWEARILDSYTGLFERIIQDRHLEIRDLVFDNFTQMTEPLAQIGLMPADH
jgi:adenylate cyclase class 2